MASNIKALTGVLKNKLLSLSVETLNETELKSIFLQKDNDTADVLKDRTIYVIQQGIASAERNLRKNADIIKYLTENDLSDVYTDAAEALINKKKQLMGKELLTGYFANPAPKAKLTENPGLKMQLDYLMHKSDFQNFAGELQKELAVYKKGQDPAKIKALMLKLDNLDKVLAQNFGNVTASINLADKVDNLRTLVYTALTRARVRLIEKSRGDRNVKAKEFAALLQVYKDALQKKQAFFQARQQKILEIIFGLQSKLVINVNKLKIVEQMKSIQLYLRANNEVIKLDEALQELFGAQRKAKGREKEIITGKILEQQRAIADKINGMLQYTKILNRAHPAILKEIKELMLFYEEFYYLQGLISQFKKYGEENIDDLNGILGQLSDRERKAKEPFLYRADKISYRLVRTYLEETLAEASTAMLYLNAKAGATAAVYVLPEEISFYGLVTVEARNFGKGALKLTFSGYSGFRADSIAGTEEYSGKTLIKTQVSFIFVDFDDAAKFIISGFKKFDLFNRLQQVKPLAQV